MLSSLFAAVVIFAAAHAQTLEGTFNTGPSLEEGARNASLDIKFHPCKDDPALSCASVVDVIEPEGQSGETTLPDGSLIIGYTMVTELKSKGDGKFRSGKIAALDESMLKGKMIWYGLKIDDQFDGTLKATGCLGFICPRTMTWTAVIEDSEEGAEESSEAVIGSTN